MAATPHKLAIPGPPPLPVSLDEIMNLARQQATDALIENLRGLAEVSRHFAADGEKWASSIATWPSRIAESDRPELTVVVTDHLVELERSQERGLYPLLWSLEDQRREVEQYPPTARAAWLGVIDPMIKGIREPLEVIRATKLKLQQADGGQGATEAEANLRSLLAYKNIADEVFETDCTIRTELIGGERFHVIDIPVPDPGVSHKDKEEKVHSTLEVLSPELVGRIVLQYVPRRGAA